MMKSIESFFAVIVLLSTDFKPTPIFNSQTVAVQARFFPAVPCDWLTIDNFKCVLHKIENKIRKNQNLQTKVAFIRT